MKLYEVPTPAVLVDLDSLEENIRRAAQLAGSRGKELWPMFKTSKSSYIARLQVEAGAKGFLCSCVEEAEVIVGKKLAKIIMLAYPVADRMKVERVIRLAEQGTRVILRIDNLEQAELLEKYLKEFGARLEYCVKVDVGYGRLGVKPGDVGVFVRKLCRFSHLEFVGIATHQGHAYHAGDPSEVEKIARESALAMDRALRALKREGFEAEIVGAGSTPTYRFDVEEPIYTHLFPGNYVFYDRSQVLVYGSAKLENCALTLLTTFVSVPQHAGGRLAVIDAGWNYIDRELRGGIEGYGQLIEKPRSVVVRISQEISLVETREEAVKVGEKVRVLPNHACYTSNAADMLVAHRGDKVVGLIPLDARKKVPSFYRETGLPKVLE